MSKPQYTLKIIAIVYFSLFSYSSFGQSKTNLLDWKADVSLNSYLVQQMHQQYASRRVNFQKALKSKVGIEYYIQSVKTNFKKVLGQLPDKTALNAKITGELKKDDYRIQKIVYESFKDHHVTANLYLPNRDGKHPAVLLFCGHEDLAKATVSYQQTAILFAKNGFAVFVIDPISQSERVQLTASDGKSLTRGSTTEHTLLNLSSNLVGTSVAAYELFDNIRGLDYLVSRPEIDAGKIGCVGNSGGAMQAIYFAAFDERVKVFAACSYLASREQTLSTLGAADGCAQIPREGFAQLEMADYLIAAAPKPVLILAGRYDFIDYNATLSSYQDLQRVYKSLNSPGKLSLFSFDDGHGISKPKREKAVQWFRKWFFNDNKTVIEGDLTTASEQDLFATSTGKVNTNYAEEITVQKRNLQLFEAKVKNRELFAQHPLALRKQKLKSLLGLTDNPEKLEVEDVGSIGVDNMVFNRFILRKNQELPLPVSVYRPANQGKKIVIWLSDDANKADSIRAHYKLQSSDEIVVFADVSGTGETTDKVAFNDPKYFSNDYRNAMLALHIGKPLVGQRTSDILKVIDFINSDSKFNGLPIEINAIGLVGIPALHAGFLNQSINKINLYQCVSSYRQILNEPLAKNRYGAVIPNVLSYYDLPDLIKWVGSDKVNVVPN